ncbi:hypothetical protein [Devosia sp. A449]
MTAPMEPKAVLSGIPEGLRTPLIDEFNKVIRNYREGRWEPAELNGGKLCEVVYSILRGYVDGNFPDKPSKPPNMVAACRDLEKAGDFPRSVKIQMPRLILALYEIRNNRNVGHVGADVDPNHMDATVVVAISKWLLAELVRIFHSVSIETATVAVDGLVERNIPLVWKVGDRLRILSNELSAKDKFLIVLYSTMEFTSIKKVLSDLEYSNPSRFRSSIITPIHKMNLIYYDKREDSAIISPLGIKYVEDTIAIN